MKELAVLTLAAALLSPVAALHAADAPARAPARSQRAPDPALAPVADVAGLPRVLLIGDSVSIAYTRPVRELLKGKANVHRPPTNCSSTGNGLNNLKSWLGDAKWDAIHFNFGLHDAKLPPEGVRHAPPDVYEKNLRELVKRMQATGAKLIFATTTPVPNGGNLAPDRRFGSVDEYNAVALRVMKDCGVAVNDLNAAIAPHLATMQRPNDVHFTDEGSALLARHVVAAVGAALGVGAPPVATPSAPRRPNIVVILSDDMGYADIGAHGCADIPTPNIDSIAKGGVRFTDAYANGSFCTPTRAALIGCRYQQRYGIEDLGGPLPAQAITLPQRLKAAGYVTGMVGKWHLGAGEGFTPVDRGFDEFFGFLGGGHQYILRPGGKGEYNAPILRNREPVHETRYLTDAFGEEAVAFVARQRGAAKPFFLYLAFNAVHCPLQAIEKHMQRFEGIGDSNRRTYAAMLSAMDDAVGLVLRALDETGVRDNTLVVFSNDNGGPTTRNAVNGSRNTPLRGSKCETFEGGIRVPLLMRWPGVLEAGGTYGRPVISLDISATALTAAGADATLCDGVDLLPFLAGKRTGEPHDALFWRSRTMSGNHGARQGDWKFVHSTEGGATPGPAQTPARDMLFNLADDIGERRDLAAENPGKLAELRKLYEAWSDGVDADCRALGLRPKFPGETAPAAPGRKGAAGKPERWGHGIRGVRVQSLESLAGQVSEGWKPR
jgi:arylsulfatase A-like enzyme/lysophospholipase L1-like esterase